MKPVDDVKKKEISLEQLREKLGLTQKELAAIIGVSERSISRYETKKREPTFTIKQFKALMAQLQTIDVDLSDLPDNFI